MSKALQMTDLENHLRKGRLKLVLEHTFSIHFGDVSMSLSLREFPTKMSQQAGRGFPTRIVIFCETSSCVADCLRNRVLYIWGLA